MVRTRSSSFTPTDLSEKSNRSLSKKSQEACSSPSPESSRGSPSMASRSSKRLKPSVVSVKNPDVPTSKATSQALVLYSPKQPIVKSKVYFGRAPPLSLRKEPSVSGFPSWTHTDKSTSNKKVKTSEEKELTCAPSQPTDSTVHPVVQPVGPPKVQEQVPTSPKKPEPRILRSKKTGESSSAGSKQTEPTSPQTKKKVKKSSSLDDSGYVISKAFSRKFYAKSNSNLWKLVSQRRIYSERILKMSDFEKIGMIKFLNERNLLGTVSKAKGYVPAIVYEFYVNLYRTINDSASSQFHRIYVRGYVFKFSPTVISEFLGCDSFETNTSRALEYDLDMNAVTAELTGNTVTKWPENHSVASSKLTVKYAVLFKIAAANWMPTTHTTSVLKDQAVLLYVIGTGISFDMGRHIFELIVSHAESQTTYGILPFPCLIYEILMSQKKIKEASEVLVAIPQSLKVSAKLFDGSHVIDIQGETLKPTQEATNAVDDNVAPDVATSSRYKQVSLCRIKMLQFLKSDLEAIQQQKVQLTQQENRIKTQIAQLEAIPTCESDSSASF